MIQLGTSSVTYNYNNTQMRLGRGWYYIRREDTTTFYGSIQAVRIYNRLLTDEELKENFEVDKKRFNISTDIKQKTKLLGSQISANNYGMKTDFKSKEHDNLLWRVFYKDDDNVYLISSVDEGQGEVRTLTSDLDNTKNTISDLGKALNPLYTASDGAWSMSLLKEQIVAYLLDENEWDSYRDAEGNATWAIGGPPMEMYINSLRQAAPDLVDELWVEAGYGYRVSGTIASNGCISEDLKYGIYGGSSLNYSITSPCGSWGSNDRICGIHNHSNGLGYFWNQEGWKWSGYSQYNSDHSRYPDGNLRPIVCIPIDKFNYTLYSY